LPRISNFTDFDPLLNDNVNITFAEGPDDLDSADAIIIPGTKNTIEDLKWLREKGFEKNIRALWGKVPIIGICGGYQMIGKSITDDTGKVKGLGLLDVETRFEGYEKTTNQKSGKVLAACGIFKEIAGAEINGYEIHMGQTKLGGRADPVFELDGGPDGAVDESGMVFGTYLHGIFDSSAFREGFLKFLGSSTPASSKTQGEIWDESIDRAAKVVSDSIDLKRIEEWVHE
jgi:adenosylcobyric acid synthase